MRLSLRVKAGDFRPFQEVSGLRGLKPVGYICDSLRLATRASADRTNLPIELIMSEVDTEVMRVTTQPSRGDVADVGELALRPSVERAVAAVSAFLGMDVAYATEFVDDHQVFRVLRGDGASFGVHEGLAMPLQQTYCQRVLDGRLPSPDRARVGLM